MAITNGTNVTALEKPAVGIDAGPGWATAINNSIDAVDGHDHSSNKGIRITPAAVNINADLDYNSNSATELKNVVFNSTVAASSTNYSLYQSSGNLFFRDGSGTAIQMTITGTVNSGAGSIAGMSGTDAGASYTDGSKTFNFFTDSANVDYGKMAHADLLLYKFSDDNSADTDYVIIAANAGVSGASGTIYVPSENGTFLTTNTSYATSAINVATSASNYPINLKPHGTGHVVIGNAGATGKLTSNGAFDLILDTNSGTNSSTISITDAANGNISFIPNGTGEIVVGSGSATGKITTSGAHNLELDTNGPSAASSKIRIVDGANGNIEFRIDGTGEVVIGDDSGSGKITSSGAHDLVLDTNSGTNAGTLTLVDGVDGNIDITPNGSGEVNISKVDINGGTLAAITIDGNWTAASQTCADLGTVTTTGTIGLGGKLTAGSNEIEGSNFDINGGTLAAITIDGNWTAASQTCADLGAVTTTGTIGLGGKLTAGSNEIEGSNFDINGGAIDAVTIGTNSACTDLRVDNLKIDANDITSTDTNGNINLTPAGTGEVNISKVDIAGGEIDACGIGDNIRSSGRFTELLCNTLPLTASGDLDGYAGFFYNAGDDVNRKGLEVKCGANDGFSSKWFTATTGGGAPTGYLVTNSSGVFYLDDTSDVRLKENIVDSTVDGYSIINQLKLREFKWKSSDVKVELGLVANEVIPIYSEAVNGEVDAVFEDGSIDPITISMGAFVPVLLKGFQQMTGKVEALEARISVLES